MTQTVQFADVFLRTVHVGWLLHDQTGHNRFVVAPDYIDAGPERPILSLSFVDPGTDVGTVEALRQEATHPTTNRLPRFFSNLLPEGALRDHAIQEIGTHRDNEFALILALGKDLSGAIRVVPADDKRIPLRIINEGRMKPVPALVPKIPPEQSFSLAGVQMKFSMSETDTGYTLIAESGTHIIKTPSPQHAQVPANEHAMMRLAAAIDIDVPETELVEVARLEGLPPLNLPDEKWAYRIRRFDRPSAKQRLHTEDFAQILGLYPHHKYETNHPTMIRAIKALFPRPFETIEDLLERIVFNVLIGNTDAHAKNWSIIYREPRTPELAPAYDLVSTLPYLSNRNLGLNLFRKSSFYRLDEAEWKRFARKADIPERFVLTVVRRTVDKAATAWATQIAGLPISPQLLDALKQHWRQLPLILSSVGKALG